MRGWKIIALLLQSLTCFCQGEANYRVGVGKADITGPAADVNLMGYANPGQLAGGIHTRLYARSFLVADKKDPKQRFIFVNTDACMAAQGVTLGVFEKLKTQFGGIYTEQNVAISGIHTHSGPGGYLQYVLYDITSLGFVRQSYDALVDGILLSIRRAHENIQDGSLEFASGELLEANINRSPTSYLYNPAEERAKYKHDVDKELTLLKVSNSDRAIGGVSWFPVHCTSINNTNKFISGDNKGVAAQYLEKWGQKEGKEIITAFAQANVGDTSPNTKGAFCQDTGLPCSKNQSLCNGRNEMCIGRGPAYEEDDHGFKSNSIIASRQYHKARELWDGKLTSVSGEVEYRHKFVDMTNILVKESNFTRAGKTCPAAMGMSFAAGTTDGPGAFDFKQGDTKGTLFWRAVAQFLNFPSQEQIDCQAPKPILLNTGQASLPYAWQPAIVDIQILRVGQFVILCVPGEFTTMAGRRLREAIAHKVRKSWGSTPKIVIAGLTNTYSGYITTFEEYREQRFEAAATAYGPHTLDAYIQEFLQLADEIIEDKKFIEGPRPPNLINKQLSFLPGIVLDLAPPGSSFGKVLKDVGTVYSPGQIVSATFQSACPRNNLRSEDTFLTVEKKDDDGIWHIIHTDNDTSTKFAWERPFMISPTSTATISWEIPESTETGWYRLSHRGNNKQVLGGVGSFSGFSSPFHVMKPGLSLLGRLENFWQGLVTKFTIR